MVKKKQKIEEEKPQKRIANKREVVEISGKVFCDIKGLSSRAKFFIVKKYGNKKMTQDLWTDILKKDQVV